MKSEQLIEHLVPDREIAEPSYLQVAQKLTQLIEAGDIEVGQSLPSERVLAEKLQLSRTTVRRAYDELWAKDYLRAWRSRPRRVCRRAWAVSRGSPR
jgi:GntR family transcriptional regulator